MQFIFHASASVVTTLHLVSAVMRNGSLPLFDVSVKRRDREVQLQIGPSAGALLLGVIVLLLLALGLVDVGQIASIAKWPTLGWITKSWIMSGP